NTMMNQYCFEQYGTEMDEDALIAKQGTVCQRLLDALMEEPFLQQEFPKTTGPELFNLDYLKKAQERSGSTEIPQQDVLATLSKFSALAIAQGIKMATHTAGKYTVYISGGGLHNPLLVAHIRQELGGVKVSTFADLGLDPDAKEACLFAILANETLAGDDSNVKMIKDSPAVCMGKLSFPY